jgi:cell wall-associated NlpC family hydrolase
MLEQASTLPLDSNKLFKAVESIAFPESKFVVLERMPRGVCRVITEEYFRQEVYVDERFLILTDEEPTERKRTMPDQSTLLAHLESLVGTRYIWGGNWPSGIPFLLECYPPGASLSQLDPLIADTWQLKGVDCSGLLYYATNGSTPRNTSELLNWGRPVPVAGKNMFDVLEPLDLIVWRGHVILVFDKNWTIESLVGEGVIKRPFAQRIEQIVSQYSPVDDYAATESMGERFVVRRWVK